MARTNHVRKHNPAGRLGPVPESILRGGRHVPKKTRGARSDKDRRAIVESAAAE